MAPKKLLVITQAVDLDDPVLGFFHSWLLEFGRRMDEVEVIALKVGRHELSSGVGVHSLGKEMGLGKFSYIWNFYKHLFALRNKYEAVFVHMNEEYVLLGGLFWKLWGKPVFLWRNHRMGSWKTKTALWFVRRVYFTSPEAFTAASPKGRRMGAGIDLNEFAFSDPLASPGTILSLGRLDPVKKLEPLFDAVLALGRRGEHLSFSVFGNPTPGGEAYAEKLKEKLSPLISSGTAVFASGIPNRETPKVYAANRIFVNLTPAGSLDKTILEAMAVGSIPLVLNPYFKMVLPSSCLLSSPDSKEIAKKLRELMSLGEREVLDLRLKNRKYVEDNHSLKGVTAFILEDIFHNS